MTFIAGAFTGTYNAALGGAGALSLGICEDGFELEEIHYGEPIKGDNAGDAVQDVVYRGRDVFLSAVFEECDLSGLMRCMNPHVAQSALSDQGRMGTVGMLHTNLAGILLLTAVAGTTAATVPATLTAGKAILAPGQSMRRLLASRLRKVPIRFQLLPYVDSLITRHYLMA
jgi:hypothetical protein